MDRTTKCRAAKDASRQSGSRIARTGALLIVAAGGTGLYSAVMPSWGAGPHGNGHLTVEIDLDQACEVPSLG